MKPVLFSLIAALSFFSFTSAEEPKDEKRHIVEHFFQKDDEEITIFQVTDEHGMPQYYYCNIRSYPCKAEKVCKMMDLRMYWDALGNYLQFELRNGDKLTKLNHKPFSKKEYRKLHKILNNPDSEMQHCKFDELTSKQTENQYHLDAVSGATNKDFKFEYISGAIKTTYFLWHFAHGAVGEKIRSLTAASCGESQSLASISSENYENTSSSQKFRQLFARLSSDENLSDAEESFLMKDMLKEKCPALTSAILLNLYKHDKNFKVVAKSLKPYLKKGSQFVRTATFNILQQAGQRRAIKKTAIVFDEVNF
ncbi:MAG: hypothetical protein MI784_10870 [Cytophagales bacterium]|nr:hypothetical protein [Cytophagales bacterium]